MKGTHDGTHTHFFFTHTHTSAKNSVIKAAARTTDTGLRFLQPIAQKAFIAYAQDKLDPGTPLLQFYKILKMFLYTSKFQMKFQKCCYFLVIRSEFRRFSTAS